MEKAKLSRKAKILIIIFVIIAVIAAMPIWHQHGGVDGRMHGHPLWGGGHIH